MLEHKDSVSPILDEDPITLAEAAKHHFQTQPAPSTVWRWGPGGGVKGVILEHVQIGGQYYTSVPACKRFLEALNQPKTSPVKTPRSRKQRTASKKKAEAILKARGI